MILNKPEYTRKINSAIFPGTQGGPLMHIIAAKAQCFYEALQPDFHLYTERVIANANMMAKTFILYKSTGGTDSHIILNGSKQKQTQWQTSRRSTRSKWYYCKQKRCSK